MIPEGVCQCGCGQQTAPCKVTNARLGYVKGKPNRYVRGHGRRRRDPFERDPDTGCWNWTAALTGHGYGTLMRDYKQLAAHRVVYEDRVGPIPEGYEVHHRCENTRCVNPDHLEALSRKDHAATKAKLLGERNHLAKLTSAQVREIRLLCDQGWRRKDIAAAYGIHHVHASRIARRELRVSG